jgi:hypothetical protein
MKAKYQKGIATTERKDELKLNFIQAMHMIMTSWHAVSSTVIFSSYFRKAGFITIPDMHIEEKHEDEIGEARNKLTFNSDIHFTDSVNCDDILTAARLGIDKICDAAKKDKEEKGIDSEEVEEVTLIPMSGEAVVAFEAV